MSITSALGTQNVIGSTALTSTDTSATDAASEKAEEDKINFLNLLLTQLANQNPLDPMDTDEYTAQLTRYSQLEQQIDTNENLAIMTDLLSTTADSTVFSYIGNQVEISSNVGVVQNNSVNWSYYVDGNADDVTLTVTDEDGNQVYQAEGNASSGVQTFSLQTEGTLLEGKALYLSVAAVDDDNASLSTEVSSTVTVDGVWNDGDSNYLTAGDVSFLENSILKLATPAVVASTVSTSETDETSDDTTDTSEISETEEDSDDSTETSA